jgi:transposase
VGHSFESDIARSYFAIVVGGVVAGLVAVAACKYKSQDLCKHRDFWPELRVLLTFGDDFQPAVPISRRCISLFNNSLALPDLRFDAWRVVTTQTQLVLQLTSLQPTPSCPVCHQPAARLHSRYQRTLTDLPWSGYGLQIQLSVRKLFCDNAGCPRRIFTERLPDLTEPWARRTNRLAERLTTIGLALGGAPGARLRALLH